MKLQTVLMLSDGVCFGATVIAEGRSRWLGRPYRVVVVVVVVVVGGGGGGGGGGKIPRIPAWDGKWVTQALYWPLA